MSSILQSRKYYINSANRVSGSNQIFQYTLDIPPSSQYDSIAVCDVSIPLSFYVVDAPYNQFTLQEGTSLVSITIPSGNYNVNTFQTALTSLLNSSSPHGWVYSMSFNSITAQYTYSVTGNTSQPSFLFSDFLVSQMGFSNNSTNTFVSGSLVSTDVVSFVAQQALFIHCDLISENNNNILQDIYVNNAVPYSYVTYSCQNIEHYSKPLLTNLHSTINISLLDILGNEILLNGLDWSFSIILYKKNNLTEMFRRLLHFISASTGISGSEETPPSDIETVPQ